ncbi:MAG: hypothetical protein KBC84_00940 [Proteobacteria bacterium]|nr:hypothetical protein [Pseudomonadota bacterium]
MLIVSILSAKVTLAESSRSSTSLLQKISLTKTESNLILPINIKSERRCSFGDFDAMFFDAQHSSYPLIGVTLEGLVTRDKEVLSGVNISQIKLDFINKATSATGFNYDLPLPLVKEPVLLGVYICKDSKSDGNCSSKPYVGVNEILKSYKIESQLPEDYESEDKVYFFSFIVLDKDGIWVPTKPFNEDRYEELKKSFGQIMGKSFNSNLAVNRMKAINYILGSEQLRLLSDEKNNKSLGIILPKVQPESCYKNENQVNQPK